MSKSSNVVLLIDDEPKIRRFLRAGFELQGFSVLETENAADGLKAATFNAPDLIILDIGLPAGDGFVVLERLQQSASLSNIPVIVLTARDPQSTRDKIMKAGATAFFQKPADNGELLGAIRAVLAPVWPGTASAMS